MSACLCPFCAATPAPTFTPEFRIACEARMVLGWPLETRRAYLAARPVQARRAELEAEMRRQWTVRPTA